MKKTAIVRKLQNGKYRLYSKKKDKSGKRRNLGTYDSLEEVKKREREIQYFKHNSDDGMVDDKETKALNELSEIAQYLEKAGFIDKANTLYCVMDLIDESLCEDYALDMIPYSQVAGVDGMVVKELDGTGGSSSLFSMDVGASNDVMVLKKVSKKLKENGFDDDAEKIDGLVRPKTCRKCKRNKLRSMVEKLINDGDYSIDDVVNLNGFVESQFGDPENGSSMYGGLGDWYMYGY